MNPNPFQGVCHLEVEAHHHLSTLAIQSVRLFRSPVVVGVVVLERLHVNDAVVVGHAGLGGAVGASHFVLPQGDVERGKRVAHRFIKQRRKNGQIVDVVRLKQPLNGVVGNLSCGRDIVVDVALDIHALHLQTDVLLAVGGLTKTPMQGGHRGRSVAVHRIHKMRPRHGRPWVT